LRTEKSQGMTFLDNRQDRLEPLASVSTQGVGSPTAGLRGNLIGIADPRGDFSMRLARCGSDLDVRQCFCQFKIDQPEGFTPLNGQFSADDNRKEDAGASISAPGGVSLGFLWPTP
jgi:hypothetical protein